MRGTSAGGFAGLWVWDRLRDALPWYYDVARNRMPAKYLIARRVPCGLDLEEAGEGELWSEHARLTERFLALWRGIRERRAGLSDLPAASPSLLDLSVELVQRMVRHCTFCRWNCRVDRVAGTKRGTCQLDSVSRVSTYFHHRGEELIFRGTRGSGTIFFTSCCQRCQFCQNSDISHDRDRGLPMSPRQIAAAAWQLRMEGCHNINWVGGEPTPHLHNIVEAMSLLGSAPPSPEDLDHAERAKADAWDPYPVRASDATYGGELNAPMLWNSNFFMGPEAMRILRPLMDIWLPDFKFGNDTCAVFLSRTPWYVETVAGNHKLVHDWGEDVVIRHLVMPGHVECCTKPVLRWIAENTPRALVNVMDQYHPEYACDPGSPQFDERYRSMARRPHPKEILEAYECAESLGLRFEDVTFEKTTMGLEP
jgi:putative pyruvate formate lyase activating enzyme